jgi:hypothetical protein
MHLWQLHALVLVTVATTCDYRRRRGNCYHLRPLYALMAISTTCCMIPTLYFFSSPAIIITTDTSPMGQSQSSHIDPYRSVIQALKGAACIAGPRSFVALRHPTLPAIILFGETHSSARVRGKCTLLSVLLQEVLSCSETREKVTFMVEAPEDEDCDWFEQTRHFTMMDPDIHDPHMAGQKAAIDNFHVPNVIRAACSVQKHCGDVVRFADVLHHVREDERKNDDGYSKQDLALFMQRAMRWMVVRFAAEHLGGIVDKCAGDVNIIAVALNFFVKLCETLDLRDSAVASFKKMCDLVYNQVHPDTHVLDLHVHYMTIATAFGDLLAVHTMLKTGSKVVLGYWGYYHVLNQTEFLGTLGYAVEESWYAAGREHASVSVADDTGKVVEPSSTYMR